MFVKDLCKCQGILELSGIFITVGNSAYPEVSSGILPNFEGLGNVF